MSSDPLDNWKATATDVAEYFNVTVDHVRHHPEKFLGTKVAGVWRFNIARILHRGETAAKRKASR